MRFVTIKTAAPLTESAAAVLRRRFESLLGEEATFTFEQDPALVGGFLAYVDGKLYDISMLTQLREIRNQSVAFVRGIKLDRKSSEKQSADKLFYSESISEHFTEWSKDLDHGARVTEYGTVLSCADGIVHIEGLAQSRYGEILKFEDNVFGMALELSDKGVGAVLFSDANEVYAGAIVQGTGRVLDIRVGKELLGRVVDPLGRPLDGMPLTTNEYRRLESPAPSIMDRAPVDTPLQTGILSIDSMIPIGKGQRELIIGDRQMGKSVIALCALLNQSKKNVVCVYCAIGQKASTITQTIELIKNRGNIENCVVVASTASDSAAMQYIAPYAGCAIAEFFMHQGRDVLIVYDDLTKHATSYRTMSLLLKRPPGREAYPGDVFYLHSRLLERAARLSDANGGGSLTALPIVETMAGDISGYIPTNVISITDGQIYLESELFHAGIRPAVNVGLSVSRVGRAAQPKAMRDVSGTLRLDLAQYRELAVFAQFDSDLDSSTRAMLDRGERLTELLKQDKDTVYALSEQVAILIAFQQGVFSDVPLPDIGALKADYCQYLWDNERHLMEAIDHTEAMGDVARKALDAAIARFKSLHALRAQG